MSTTTFTAPTDKLFTWEEIMKHTSERDCWIVINNNVIDVTDWLPLHPGGFDTIQQMGGKDATNMFQAIDAHVRGTRAAKEWQSRVIGMVDPNSKRPQPKPVNLKNQKPIRYGLQINPIYFWLGILVVLVLLIWFAM